MFSKLAEHPWAIPVLVILIVLLFGANKLPTLARSLGQSMRIFKSEVGAMHEDDKRELETTKDVAESKAKQEGADGRI